MEEKKDKPLVSICVLTYNGEKTIEAALNSVFDQIYDKMEVIVVDNASEDGTVDALRNLVPSLETKFLSFKLICNKENIGFAGHNIGIEKSKGEFVLCMNQDVILDKNFITEAVKLAQQDEKIGAVQGKLLKYPIPNNQYPIIDTTGHMIFKSRRMVDRGQGEKDEGQYDKIEEVFGVNGAVAFFRKTCLEDVAIILCHSERSGSEAKNFMGGKKRNTMMRSFGLGPQDDKKSKDGNEVLYKEYYDLDFFMYKEDVDLSWRIRLYGWKIMHCPKATAYVERTSKAISEKSGAVKEVIKTRRKQSQFVKNLSFKNHRLTILKNDLPWLFIKHLPWILPREIAAWSYAFVFEPKTWPVIGKLCKQLPRAWKKRRVIMKKRRVGAKEMGKWFR